MNKVTIKNEVFELNGELTIEGVMNFKGINKNGEEKEISSYKGMKVISVFPDINTSVCDTQTQAISKMAFNNPEINFISVTTDTPEIVTKWCAANGVDNIDILSDDKFKEFQNLTNTLIVKANKLARGFIILDENNKVLESDFKSEITDQPEYSLVEKYIK